MGPVDRRRVDATGTAALAFLTMASAAAMLVVWDRADAVRDERDLAVANAVATRFGASVEATVTALSGADVLATDGAVDAAEFEVFAAGVVESTDYAALAFADIVDRSERSDWEAAHGLAVLDTDGAGGFLPAATRESYLPVRYVWPDDEARSVLGFDLASDPMRRTGAAQATRTPDPVLVGPINLAAGGQPGVFAIHDVTDGTGEVVGFLASGVNPVPIVERAVASTGVDDVGPVALWVDGQVLTEPDADVDGPRLDVVIGQRTFTIQTSDRRGMDWFLPVLASIGTMLLLVVTALSWRRDVAGRARLQRARARSERLAALADDLASATTVDDTLAAGLVGSRVAMDATYANIARVDSVDPSKLTVMHCASMDEALSGRYSVQRRDEHLPLTDCVNSGRPVCVTGRADYRTRYGQVMADVEAAGIHSVICHPIVIGSGQLVGAVGYAFTTPMTGADVDELMSAGEATAAVIGRAWERSLARDAARDHAELLSAFAASLSTAHTVGDVGSAVETWLPGLFSIEGAELIAHPLVEATAAAGRVHRLPSADTAGVHLVGEPAHGWDATQDALLATVVQLIDGAWVRARQHDQEHAVLDRLQTALLAGAPTLDGFDIAVAYRSALDTVGLGGDWYSVVERRDVVYLVVGDVAGHGPASVAVMAEAKSIIRHLLGAGASITEVLRQADAVFARQRTFASIVIVCIEVDRPRLTYVNAGHPFPIIRHRDSTAQPLDRTHRPLLGVAGTDPSPSTADFGVGDTLLLYTDGLIERRGVPLDRSIDELAVRFDAVAESPCDAVIERLLAERPRDGSVAIGDDIAVVAVRRS